MLPGLSSCARKHKRSLNELPEIYYTLFVPLSIQYLIDHAVSQLIKFTFNVRERHFIKLRDQLTYAFINRP